MSLTKTIHIKRGSSYAVTWRKYEHRKTLAWVRGSILLDNKFYREDSFPSPLSKIATLLDHKNSEGLSSYLRQLNGFFAVVVQNDQAVFAAVDRVRSIPLFYGQAKGQVFLSDEAEWVRQSIGDSEVNSVARQEFLFAGYVTGRETLFPRVCQLQAGEYLLITRNEDVGFKLQTQRYYRFLPTEPKGSINEEALLAELDAVSEKSVQRLIDYATGRQIVVPLSGGYDSRLITVLLKRLKYDNVLTFSYGVPGNRESAISKDVAAYLNYKWVFVRYSRRLWRKWWESEERMNYQRWASNWTSLPHLQDWPAVWILKEKGYIHKDAVFVPGHTSVMRKQVDMVDCLVKDGRLKTSDIFFHALCACHYNLLSAAHNQISTLFKDKVRLIMCGIECKGIDEIAGALDSWTWQERQAKFIINSVRAYEFWGFDWYLPLWDRELMSYWKKIPLSLRINKILYKKFVNAIYAEQRNQINNKQGIQVCKMTSNNSEQETPEHFFIRALKSLPSRHKDIIRRMVLPISIVLRYINEPLAFYGRYSKLDYVKFSLKGYSAVGLSAYSFIKEVSRHSRDENNNSR